MSDSSHDPGVPLNAAEMQAIADRSRVRSYSSLIGAGVTLIALVAFVVIAILFLNSANKNDLTQESTNCARLYGSILNGPVQTRDNLTSEIAAYVGAGQGIFDTAILNAENGVQPTPAVFATFEANRALLASTTVALQKEIVIVKSLPTNAEATAHGFTFEGVHHPACPSRGVNEDQRAEAIFGLFDGVVSLVGLVFGLIIARASRHDFILAGLGAALSATVSMSTGAFESAKGTMQARLADAGAMGVATLVGSLLPLVSFFWLPRDEALVISSVLCLAAAGWIGFEKRKGMAGPLRWYSGYASSFAFLLAAAGITLGVVSWIGGG